MLIPGSRRELERAVPPGGTHPVRSARRILRLVAPALAVASAIAVPLAAAGPANADQARKRQQWVLAALQVPAAWKITHGGGVTVAVIDSGVDPTVSDLTGSVKTGPDYTGVHTPETNPNWGAHGTWMASLIAGHGHGKGNKDGILGVAPKSRILSIRVITDQTDPGYPKYHNEPAWRAQLQLAKAIRYAVNSHAGVISMSLGYDAASLAVRSALQYALGHNVVVVASSGNEGTSQTRTNPAAPYSFPADYPGVIGVAAVSESGHPAYFSSENLSVQVAAPGVDVPAQGRGSKYWLVSGTSPACALTAGVAALIRSRYSRLTAAQVRNAITLSTTNRPSTGYDDQVGFGTVDAAAALKAAGQLARQTPGGNTAAEKAAASGRFGRGNAGGPTFPVAPRGREKLLVLLGISAACLLIVLTALWRLIAGRGRRKSGSAARPKPTGPSAPAGSAGYGGNAGSGLYPTQIYPAQPYRQPRPDTGYLGMQAGYPVPGYLGQPAPSGHQGPVPPWPSTGYPPAQETPGQGAYQLSAPAQASAIPAAPSQPAPTQDSGRSDDEWWIDQDDRAGAQSRRTSSSQPDVGRWSASLSERLEAAAQARRQAEASGQNPVPGPDATTLSAGPFDTARPTPGEPEPGARSWALDWHGDVPGAASTTAPRAPTAAEPGQPVYRSVWEPPARSSGAPGSPPAVQSDEPATAPPVSGYSRSTGISRQPSDEVSSQGDSDSPPDAWSPPLSGSTTPLPRRQPQTHLAAQLRRQRPQAGQTQGEPSQPKPSIWDVRRPPTSNEQAASSQGPDPRDDQA